MTIEGSINTNISEIDDIDKVVLTIEEASFVQITSISSEEQINTSHNYRFILASEKDIEENKYRAIKELGSKVTISKGETDDNGYLAIISNQDQALPFKMHVTAYLNSGSTIEKNMELKYDSRIFSSDAVTALVTETYKDIGFWDYSKAYLNKEDIPQTYFYQETDTNGTWTGTFALTKHETFTFDIGEYYFPYYEGRATIP